MEHISAQIWLATWIIVGLGMGTIGTIAIWLVPRVMLGSWEKKFGTSKAASMKISIRRNLLIGYWLMVIVIFVVFAVVTGALI